MSADSVLTLYSGTIFYLTSHGAASIEDVNEYLQDHRVPPIGLRTYQH